MASKSVTIRQYLIPAGIFIVLLISLYIMSSATQASSKFNETFTSLVLLNIAGALFLFALLVSNVQWLWKQYRKHAVGSRITIRIVVLFLALSVTPTAIVFYFSNQLLHQSVDSWFDVQIDDAMQSALELSQRSLDQRTRQTLRQTRELASGLEAEPDVFLSLTLTGLREQSNANELTAFTKQGRIIATTNIDPGILIPNPPDDAALLQAKLNGEYIGLEPDKDGGLLIRALVEIKNSNPPRFLQAIYTLPNNISELANSVESAYAAYKEFSYLRQSLKFSFSLTLSLVLLFSLLAASWAAFLFARQLVAPIHQLVKGTQAIAKGDYETKLKATRRDELGFLVTSFNDMTARISNSRKQAQIAQIDAENQHSYLQTILAHLSNGVLSFDLLFNLVTSNKGADEILELPLSTQLNNSLTDIENEFSQVRALIKQLDEKMSCTNKTWQFEFLYTINHKKKTLLLRGAPLLTADNKHSGYVVIFDDVTPIIQSQRNAAWGEVARRLAHEIKNPLTPIQLSAERLQRNLHSQLQAKEEAILKKSTDTIINQVNALKQMVNDFSNFARPPQSKTELQPIGIFIEDVLSLYQGQIKQLNVHIDDDLPELLIDPVRLRQVIINLIKNAQEAISTVPVPQIDVSVRECLDQGCIEISIADNGPGVDNSQIEHIFEPYVTSKEKGTGLGLAIVKKIIEEHGGHIHLQQNEQQGAVFIIRLSIPNNESTAALTTENS